MKSKLVMKNAPVALLYASIHVLDKHVDYF